MRYVDARIEDYRREETYRIYVTRSLQLAPQKSYMSESYYDILNRKIDNRSGAEIVADVMQRGDLKFKEE